MSRWYSNKDIVPTPEAMQKTIIFYQKRGIFIIKLGCTFPNLANICLHKSTSAKFYPFTESDTDLPEKIRKDMVSGPPIVFTRMAVDAETYIPQSSNICKSIAGSYENQLFPYSLRQPMPTGFYQRCDFDDDLQRFKKQQNKTRSFRNIVIMSFVKE